MLHLHFLVGLVNSPSVSFGSVDRFSTQYYFDYTVEFFFLIDLILNFFVSFTDPDTFQPVRSLPRVAKRYLW